MNADDLTPWERKYVLSAMRRDANSVHHQARFHLENERGDPKQAVQLQGKFDKLARLIEKLVGKP